MNNKAILSQLCLVSIIVFLFIGAQFPTPAPAAPIVSANVPERDSQTTTLSTYGQLPLSFEVNQGQIGSQVKFVSRGRGYSLFLTPTEAVLALSKTVSKTEDKAGLAPTPAEAEEVQPAGPTVLHMQLLGANPAPQVVGLEELPGKVNYFIGNDPAKWRTNVPAFARVIYRGIYPNVDLVYYGNQGQLEYDFVVAPGADPGRIVLALAGADGLELEPDGNLIVQIAGEQVTMQRPLIYQKIAGAMRVIAGGYKLAGETRIGFELGAYDASRPLIIDPVLIYSTYLGGSGNELGFGVAADAAGQVYVTGWTFSLNFPTTASFQPMLLGSGDAFVTKLSAIGTPIFSTYFGGSGDDLGGDIAVDTSGNVYVTGRTGSLDFPTLNPLQAVHMGGGNDGFVTKLDSSGGLAYSTYLGGWYGDQSQSITVDTAGNAYVTGLTNSPNFPVVNPIQAAVNGGVDAFVAKLNAGGSALVYSTYLGGSGYDDGRSIAVDSAGNAYVTGSTVSTNFPTANPFQPALAGAAGSDAFVAKLDSTGAALVYSTYLGGTAGFYGDWGQGIAVDAAGSAYVTGGTFSADFPTTATSFQPAKSPGANFDAFITKLDPTGSALAYSTYLSGPNNNGDDVASDIAIDGAGHAYVAGATRSIDFPTLNAVQPTIGGSKDAFIVKLNPAGSALIYSTFLGGSAEDNEGGVLGEGPYGPHIAVDPAGNAYTTGNTSSTNFPTANPFQPAFGGGLFDAFVAKIADNQPPSVEAGGPYSVIEGGYVAVTASGSDPEGSPLTFAWDLDNNGTFESPGQSVTFSAAGLESPSSYTIATRATDSGNLSATDQATVMVIYDFAGFLQPVDNLPTLNTVNAGRAIPVKFSLNGNQGLDIFASGYPTSAAVPCGNTAEDAIEQTVSAGASSLSYDAGTDQYLYVWKTEAAWAGACRTLIVKLNDGTYHRANFKFK